MEIQKMTLQQAIANSNAIDYNDTDFEDKRDQTAKADAGKPRLSLVPTEIINCIARVREYGVTKYTDPDNWKRVSKDRYHDALFRHVIAYINDPASVDEESRLPHLWHICANCAFLCELEKKK